MKKLLAAALAALLACAPFAPALAQVPQAYQATVSGKVTNVPVTAANPLPVTGSISATTSATASSLCNTAVAAGTGKPLNIDLFSALCVINVDPTTHQPLDPSAALPTGANVIGGVTGDVVDGAADSGKAVKIGGKCLTAAPTIETTGDRVPMLFDCLGKVVVMPYALPASLVSGLTTAMTGTTSTAVTGVGAPASGLFNYITTIACGNSHATVGTFVELQDGSGGTTFFTVPAAAVYGGSVISFPAPLKQPTAATALYVKDTTTGANVICSVAGFKAP